LPGPVAHPDLADRDELWEEKDAWTVPIWIPLLLLQRLALFSTGQADSFSEKKKKTMSQAKVPAAIKTGGSPAAF
jgi:hypothetical protein